MDQFSSPQQDEISLWDSLYFAYRKAKADVYYQSSDRAKLLKYEENLEQNIETLLDAINEGPGASLFADPSFTGTGAFLPKSLDLDPEDVRANISSEDTTVYTSLQQQWEQEVLKTEGIDKPFTASFRLMSDCGIGLHVLSALWIMLVGEEIDQNLFEKRPYANRIRRTRDKKYNRSSLGTFERYVKGYKEWMTDATDAMDRLIKQKKKVASFSTDAAEYFHRIPASILSSKWFKEEHLKPLKTTDLKVRLTECLNQSLINWEKRTTSDLRLRTDESSTPSLGLPVGLSCSAFLGNVVLDEFDKLIKEEVKPAYYGRYVDDITLVMEWHEEFTTPQKVWEWIGKRTDRITMTVPDNAQNLSDTPNVVFRVVPTELDASQEDSNNEAFNVIFKANKTKLLVADAESGQRTIEALKHSLQERSSEWRLLARTPIDADDIGPELISALDEAGERATRSSQLRTLSSTKSNLSLWLREYEQLEHLCDPDTWRKNRVEFYKVVMEQLLTPLKILSYSAFINRVLALALNCGDLKQFQSLVSSAAKAITQIEQNARPAMSPKDLKSEQDIFRVFRSSMRNSIRELIYATSPTSATALQKLDLAQLVSDEFNRTCVKRRHSIPYIEEHLTDYYYRLFNRDLALIPFKEVLSPVEISTVDFSGWKSDDCSVENALTSKVGTARYASDIYSTIGLKNGVTNSNFWNNVLLRSRLHTQFTEGTVDDPRIFAALVFPTRPVSVLQAISWSSYLLPKSITPSNPSPQAEITFDELNEWVVFLRGFSMKSAISATIEQKSEQLSSSSSLPLPNTSGNFGVDDAGTVVRIPRESSVHSEDKKIAVTSIFTDPNQITRSIAGKTSLDYKVYRSFAKLIDQIVSPTPARSKPDYVLFPELIMPAPWFEWFGNHLATKHGIGLISGITYLKGQSPDQVHNQIWASLPTSIIGYPIAAVYRQDKQQPAHGEEQNLRSYRPAKILKPHVKWSKPPVIWHGDFAFALLICSELTNIAHRTSLRGKIDALFIAEKNRDLNTFESLVDSAALDIHAYIAQSNSREFGDSRIRAPKKESHERDVARVRGGMNDHFVVGKIEVRKLREFQTWHYKGTDFKPLPDGFREDFDENRAWLPPAKGE